MPRKKQTATLTSSVTSTHIGVATGMLFLAAGLSLIAIPARRAPASPAPVALKSELEAFSMTTESRQFRDGAGFLSRGVVKNSGAALREFEVSFYREKADRTLVRQSTATVRNIEAFNGSREVTASFIFPDPTIAVLMKVDPQNRVREDSEENNEYWLSSAAFMRGGNQYDLGIRNLSVRAKNANESEVSFDVVNYGEVIVNNAPIALERLISQDSQQYGAALSTYINDLAPGKVTKIKHTITTNNNSPRTLRARVLENEDVEDVDSGNNTVSINF